MANTIGTVTAVDEKWEGPGRVSTSAYQYPKRSIPYWNVNVSPTQWTIDCPSFLQNQPEKNISILSTPDEHYQRQGWEVVRRIVETNQIDQFQRIPSDLRRYLEYKEQIVAKYGSVMRFVVKERLRWGDGTAEDLTPNGRPFEYDAEDIRILHNDWPYGLAHGIVHLVVWTKFALEDDPETDDLTPRARKEIDEYVKQTFCSQIAPHQVVWFKNWRSLKSVHDVEHFHVMLHNPDPTFVQEITGGDVPWTPKGV
ncbi:GIG1 family protein [Aspergillus lucknowensis]|uniref:N-acetylglucosamine-induced protein 1 n=1 Tax=Aspergillus lucknowensis TaxID=176173 RepID=A0ABR4LHX5_9EURO